jgi:hypothetical protein
MVAETEVSHRLSNSWLIGGYFAIFVGFSAIVRLDLARLSPVQDALQVDGKTHRLVVTHQDTSAAQFAMDHSRPGLHFRGRALRGLQLTVEAPRVERSCELEVPHRHTAEIKAQRLVLAFAAKSAIAGSRLLASLGTQPPGSTEGFYRVSEINLEPDWREVRAEVSLFQPMGPVTPFRTILFELKPPNAVDAWIREPRFLTEAVEPDITPP